MLSSNYGIRAFQAILKNATQSNLSFFHHAGEIQSNLILPKPSIVETLELSKSAKTSSSIEIKKDCHLGLRKQVTNLKYKDFIQHIILNTFLKHEYEWEYTWRDIPDDQIYLRVYVDVLKMASYGLTLADIASIVQKPNIICSPDFLGIIDIVIESTEMEWLNIISLFENPINDCEKVSSSTIIHDNGKYTLNMTGSSIKHMLSLSDKLHFETFYVNDIYDVYENFGIEAARELICDLLGGEVAETIANFMTRSGTIVPVGRNALKKYNRGFISYAFFENIRIGLQEVDENRIDNLRSKYSKLWRGIKLDDDSYST
jgi:hypothetical protein